MKSCLGCFFFFPSLLAKVPRENIVSLTLEVYNGHAIEHAQDLKLAVTTTN